MEIENELPEINFDAIDLGEEPSAAEQLSKSQQTASGQFIQGSQEFRESGIYDSGLANRQLDPRFQDLPKLRAASEGFFETTGKAALKFIPQTVAKLGETIGYIGDVQAYDDIFRALGNQISEGTFSDDYSDIDNWLSQVSRDTNTAFDEMLPIYLDDPERTWAPGDYEWWIKNIGNLGESVASFAGAGGLASRGLSKGLGYLAKRVAPMSARAARGSQRVAEWGSNLALSYAEGMMTGVQSYQSTYDRVYRKLKEDGIGEEEAKRRANASAGQAAAYATAQNAVILPFINYTSNSTLFRRARKPGRVYNKELRRKTGESLDDYRSRVEDFSPQMGVAREAKELGRESAFESVEELANEYAASEGEYQALVDAGVEEEVDFGERFMDTMLTPEAALSATLGAFGGAAQQGIMRRLPTIEGEDGRISQAELQRKRHQETASQEYKLLTERLNRLTKAREKIASDDPTEQKEGYRMMETDITTDSIARGVEQELLGYYKEIERLDEGKAEELGYDIDQDSPTYYKKLARRQIDNVESLSKEYKQLVNQYDFGAQEEFAGVPRALLNLRVLERNAKQEVEKAEREIESIDKAKDELDSLVQEANIAQQDRENIKLRRQTYNELRGFMEAIDQTGNGDLTLAEIASGESFNKKFEEFFDALSGDNVESRRDVSPSTLQRAQRLINFASQLDSSFKEQIKNLKNIPVKDALTALDEIDLRLDLKQKSLNEDSQNAYNNWLRETGMKNSKKSRQMFEAKINNQKAQLDQIADRFLKDRAEAQERVLTNQYEFGYISSSQGRDQLVNRVRSIYEGNVGELRTQVKPIIDNAQSKDDLSDIRDRFSDYDLGLDKYFKEKEEQLETQDIRDSAKQQENEIEEMRESSENEESFMEGLEDKMREDIERTLPDQESEEESEESETEPEGDETIVDKAKNTVNKAKEEVESFFEGSKDMMQEEQIEEARKIMLKNLKNNWKKMNKIDADIESEIRNILNRYELLTEEQKNNLVKEGLEYYNDRLSFQEEKQAPEETPYFPPPENVKHALESARDYPSSSTRAFDTGSGITTKTVETQEIDGTLYNLNNKRKESLPSPYIESWSKVLPDEKIEYRVEDRAFNKSDVTRSELRDVDNPTNEQIEEAVIGIYYTEDGSGDLLGYLRRTKSIDANTTALTEEGNNIKRQKGINRGIRRAVIENMQKGINTPGVVKNKTGGHLSINYKKDEDGNFITPLQKERQPVNEAFPDQDVTYYVIRGNQVFTSSNNHIPRSKLLNSDSFFENNEGTSGTVVKMGNGKLLATPMWIPKLNSTEEGKKAIEAISQIAIDKTNDELEAVEGIDLTDPDTLKKHIQKYVYTTSASPFDLLNKQDIDEPSRVHLVVGKNNGHIYLIDQFNSKMYTTNKSQINQDENILPFTESQLPAITEAMNKLSMNVDVHSINANEDIQVTKYRLTVDDAGNITFAEYDNYNDFIGEFMETDIDASYSLEVDGETQHLAYQHPYVSTKIDDGKRTPTSIPDINTDTNTESSDQPSTDVSSTQTQEESNLEEESEAEGDTKDALTNDNMDQSSDIINASIYNKFIETGYVSPTILDQIAEKIINGGELIPSEENIRREFNEEIEERLGDVVEETEEIEVTEVDQLQEQYDEIDTSTRQNRDSDDINNAINELERLRDEAEDVNQELANKIDDDIIDLEQELVNRRDTQDKDSTSDDDLTLSDEETDNLFDDMGFNQTSVNTENSVTENDVEAGTDLSEETTNDKANKDWKCDI